MPRFMIVVGLILSLFANSSTATGDEIPRGNRLVVATWNLEWFYDDNQDDNVSKLAKKLSAPTASDWDWKVDQVCRVLSEINPTIVALQEVENRKVVLDLTKRLKSKYGKNFRVAHIESWDTHTEQDVAIIYRSGLVSYGCNEQSFEMFKSKDFHNLSKHLVARFEWGEGPRKESLTMLTSHLRARAEKEDIRKRQCRLIHHWMKDLVAAGENVMVLGDMNTEQASGNIRRDSDMSVLLGQETQTQADDLIDLNQKLERQYKITHINGREYDRIVVSQSMVEDDPKAKNDLVFSRIQTGRELVVKGEIDGQKHFDNFYGIPKDQRDISDHYPVVAEFLFK